MSAKFISSQFIKTIQTGSRTVAVGVVDRTTAWVRPDGFPTAAVKSDFASVVEENISTFSSSTTEVALKESEHQSNMDERMHYTAYALDKDGNVIETKHLVKQRK